MLQCERSLTLVQLLQCDQIGRFLKVLGDKSFLGYIDKYNNLVKTTVVIFGQLLE